MDDDRMGTLETMLKESQTIATEAEKKYEEVLTGKSGMLYYK